MMDDFTKKLVEFTAANKGSVSANWYRAVIEWLLLELP